MISVIKLHLAGNVIPRLPIYMIAHELFFSICLNLMNGNGMGKAQR